MELRRTFLIIAMAVVGYFLMINWQKDYGQPTTKETAVLATENSIKKNGDLPTAINAKKENIENKDIPVIAQKQEALTIEESVSTTEKLISVKTDVLDLKINTVGGDVVHAALPTYKEGINSKNPFVLLDNSNAQVFIAQSGLVGANGPDASEQGRPQYTVSNSEFILGKDEKNIRVVLTLDTESGVKIHKIYEFTRGEYLIKLRYEISNNGKTPWNGVMFAQFKRDGSSDPGADTQAFGMATFLGAAWWSSEKPYNKQTFEDIEESPLKENINGGWVAMVQHYFVSAWIPDEKTKSTITSRAQKEAKEYFIGYTGPDINVAPGESAEISAQLYLGPKIKKNLEKVSDGLELTIDFGWFWFIAQGLFWLLSKIYTVVGNWGWAIILLTAFVKAVLYYPSAISYRSMAHMRRVTPEIQRLKELHGSDRAKMSQAMMDLYKKEKINPLGGCLPILIQMPVFIALYWALMESVELRHAPWILWINDLSAMDQYFILPLIMGVTMYVQQMLNPAPPDPMQAKIMKLMPVVFTVMFLWFPSGLVLYWVVNNSLSILQQWIITRQIDNAAARKA